MIVYGYVKGHKTTSDGAYYVQVRVPSIHGPYRQSEYRGQPVRNYVQDWDLPYYPSSELTRDPNDGDVVMLSSSNEKSSDFTVVGLTGGSYFKEGQYDF